MIKVFSIWLSALYFSTPCNRFYWCVISVLLLNLILYSVALYSCPNLFRWTLKLQEFRIEIDFCFPRVLPDQLFWRGRVSYSAHIKSWPIKCPDVPLYSLSHSDVGIFLIAPHYWLPYSLNSLVLWRLPAWLINRGGSSFILSLTCTCWSKVKLLHPPILMSFRRRLMPVCRVLRRAVHWLPPLEKQTRFQKNRNCPRWEVLRQLSQWK